jgi:5-methylcytosine-specific restriction endonuclease McrA
MECAGKWHMSVRKMPNEHKFGNKWRVGLRPTNAFTSEQAIAFNTIQGNIYECSYCGNQFEIKPWVERQNKSKSGMRFCSKKCNMAYRSKYLSGENSPLWVGGITTYRGKGWIAARNAAVKRDNGTCQECGKIVGKSIPVHHINPFRNYNSAQEANSLDNLVCLCQSCHMKIEHSS